jgi:hypothetical protein
MLLVPLDLYFTVDPVLFRFIWEVEDEKVPTVDLADSNAMNLFSLKGFCSNLDLIFFFEDPVAK